MDDGEGPGQAPDSNLPKDGANVPDMDEERSNNDNPDQCDDDFDNDSVEDPPSVESEPDERPTRERRAPERYDPVSGGSYSTIMKCHHLQTQRHPEERTFFMKMVRRMW